MTTGVDIAPKMKSQISFCSQGKAFHQEGNLMHEVARHAEQGQGDGEGGADLDEAGLPIDLRLAGGRFRVFRRVQGGGIDHSVTGALDGSDQVTAACHTGQVGDGRFFSGEIDADVEHAVGSIDGARDVFLAHGAGHAGDGQVDMDAAATP